MVPVGCWAPRGLRDAAAHRTAPASKGKSRWANTIGKCPPGGRLRPLVTPGAMGGKLYGDRLSTQKDEMSRRGWAKRWATPFCATSSTGDLSPVCRHHRVIPEM